MIYQAPTNQQILRRNKAMPDHLRQCSVVLEFKRPMPKHLTEHFYRVRLSRDMLADGEDEFWKPEVLQPGRIGRQKCLGCGREMSRVAVVSTICANPACAMYRRLVVNGPKRGVQEVKTEFEARHPKTGMLVDITFVVGRELVSVEHELWVGLGRAALLKKGLIRISDEQDEAQAIQKMLGWPEGKMPVDMVQGCIVVLDRRYNDNCLCAVWRTCGHLCDDMGWGLA